MTRAGELACALCLLAPPALAAAPAGEAGVLHVAVNPIYPPMEYHDPATGLDVELGDALARRLGVRIAWSESAFDQMIPSLETGRVDMILSGITDTAAREKTMDFVDYLRTGAQFYVLSASRVQVSTDLCGLKVGTSRTTSFPGDIAAWSRAHCEATGKPAIVVVGADSTAAARSELRQGRIDAAVQGSETVPYAMQLETGAFRPVGAPFTAGFQAIDFRKDEAAIRDRVASALRALVADGTYRSILARYRLEGNAVPAVTTDAASR